MRDLRHRPSPRRSTSGTTSRSAAPRHAAGRPVVPRRDRAHLRRPGHFADTLIVPACPDLDQTPPADLVEVVRAAHARGARLLSICTGAFVLAAAGVLDGRHATTHWMHAELLARRYPAVRVDASVLYREDEQRDHVSGDGRRHRRLPARGARRPRGRRRRRSSPGAWSRRRTARAGRPSSCRPRVLPTPARRPRPGDGLGAREPVPPADGPAPRGPGPL